MTEIQPQPEDPLQTAISWKRMQADANAAIEAKDYQRAHELLREAERLAATLGPEDERLADTLERIGFVYQTQGNIGKAESAYRSSLKILEKRILAGRLKRKVRSQLAKLLEDSDRSDEAKAFKDAPLPKLDHNSDRTRLQHESPALGLIGNFTLLSSSMKSTDTEDVRALLEEVLAHVENTAGADSPEAAVALELVADFIQGTAIRNFDDRDTIFREASKANKHYRRALQIGAKIYGEDSTYLVEIMRRLAFTEPDEQIKKALESKANAIEKATGTENLAHRLALNVASKLGGVPPSDLPVAEADEILNGYYKRKLQDDGVPFVTMELSGEQAANELTLIFDRSIALTEQIEANTSHPLAIVTMLGEASRYQLRLGNIAKAKAIKKLELDLIGEKWGRGHIMTLEALEEYEKL